MELNFRKVEIVGSVWWSAEIKTYTHHQSFNNSASFCLIFFEGRTWPDPTSPRAHESTSSHYDQVFGLAQIPQVVMNIDYKLEPITDKKVAAYFHDLDFNYYAKLLYDC